MLTAIRRLHRNLVDRLADTRWLKDKAGARAVWAHYERHAKAWNSNAERHARVRQQATARADALHARARARAQRWAQHGAPRTLPRWQAAIARVIGNSTVHGPRERSGR
jgi:antibiotic biosynthesis monooxygenase (ABM) superfamily enzyme